MLLLAEFSPIVPDVGMIFWAVVIFLITWLVLGKFTFKPIANALREREDTIEGALEEAKRAREEMQRIRAENQAQLKRQAEERTQMIRETKEAKEQIMREAKAEAEALRARLMADAASDIESLKAAALLDVKNAAGQISVDVAQKILRNQLADPMAQAKYADSLIEEINFN